MRGVLSIALAGAALLAPAGPSLRTARDSVVATHARAACRLRALDAEAKELARTAQTAAETIATDDDGSYRRVSPAQLHRYERSIPISRRQARRARAQAFVAAARGTRDSYAIVVQAGDGNRFTIERDPAGEIVRAARICGARRSW